MSSPWPREIDQIRTALTQRGYASALVLPCPGGRLSAGSTITIQFGDRVAVGRKGCPQLVVHGTFQINADSGPSAGLVRFSIEKTHAIPADRPFELALKLDLQLAIEADFRLSDELASGTCAIQEDQAYRHLQELVDDAYHALRDLPVDRHRKEITGPAMRVEARLVGDLALGRTGIVRLSEPAVSRDFMRCSLSACEWLQQRILPELRLVMRDLTGKSGRTASIVPARAPTARYDTRRLLRVESAGLIPEPATIQ